MKRLTRRLVNGEVDFGICFNAEIDPDLSMYEQYDLMCEKLYAYEETGVEPDDVKRFVAFYVGALMHTVVEVASKVFKPDTESNGGESDNT